MLLAAGTLCGVLTGCVSDVGDNNMDGGDPAGATFNISTRGVGDPDDPSNPDYLDYKIERLRVIAFRGGTVRSNKVYNTTLGATITHTIPAGTYDFVFIANEPSSLTSGLNALQNRTAFEAMSIAAADITRSGLIPQIQEIEGVEVQTGNKVRHDGIGDGNPTTSWPLKLVRLAARIDVALYSKTDIGTVFQGVKLTGLPDRVPLVAESSYTGTAIARTGTMEVKTAANPECFAAVSEEKLRDELPGDIAWSKQVVRLIVPFNEFTPAASAAKSIGMTILLHDRYNPSATMGFDETGTPKDYTLPRNYWLDCDGEVTTPLRLNISTTPWDDKNVNGSTTGLRKLNVSELEPPAALNNYHDKWEVSFWSNQPYVELEATGKWVSAAGETPGTEFTVSDYYDIGFSYDPVTGKGRVVFDLKDLVSAPVGLVQQAVVLRAGSAAVTGAGYLRRELKLSARYLVYAPPGVVGIRKSDGQLTLRGSSTYAGRTERFVTDGEFGELENEPVYVDYRHHRRRGRHVRQRRHSVGARRLQGHERQCRRPHQDSH